MEMYTGIMCSFDEDTATLSLHGLSMADLDIILDALDLYEEEHGESEIVNDLKQNCESAIYLKREWMKAKESVK